MNESREIASVPDRPAATNGGGTDAAADISLQGVTKHYPGVVIPAVSEIDLEIKRGEFFSLLGPSGSGKTTTLRLIAGFERPTVGRVFLAGKDVTELPPFKRDVNTVFQNYALFPHMTVERNVAYPLKMAKVAKGEITTRVGEALELVGMRGFEKRLPHQLSGGQRQRIALARALVNRPAVLLLDEPLGALDLKLRQQMQFVLKELQREVEISFVYVTHDQGEALAMSDRLAVMRDGQIEQIGRPADVYYEPATRFVAGFIGKTNLIDCEIESTGGGWVAVHNGIRLPLDGDFKAGAATASIRNEAIELRHAEGAGSPGPDAEGRGVIPAVIEEMVFLGEGREILVQAGDAKFTVRVPAERKERFARGDRVEMVVDPKDVTILYE